MEIRNLEEISPYVRISRHSGESTAEASDNGITYMPLESQISNALQIYRLFDSAFILPFAEFGSAEAGEERVNNARSKQEGFYNVQDLTLPSVVKKLFHENSDDNRMITINIPNPSVPWLSSMSQRDFPPSNNIIDLSFGYVGGAIEPNLLRY